MLPQACDFIKPRRKEAVQKTEERTTMDGDEDEVIAKREDRCAIDDARIMLMNL